MSLDLGDTKHDSMLGSHYYVVICSSTQEQLEGEHTGCAIIIGTDSESNKGMNERLVSIATGVTMKGVFQVSDDC